MHRRLKERIDAGKDRFDRPQPMLQILVHARLLRIVAARRGEHAEVMADCVLDARHGPTVEERALERGMPERRTAELVAIIRVGSDLLQSDVVVVTWSI